MEFKFPLKHTAEYRRKYCLAEKHASCKEHNIKDITHICYRKPKHKGKHKCVCELEWTSKHKESAIKRFAKAYAKEIQPSSKRSK